MKNLLKFILGIPVFILLWFAMARLVRRLYQFPIPEFLASFIDNPFRRKFQPPEEMPVRFGIQPGMSVLEVGPGNGRYTAAVARAVGPQGSVVAVDIEPKMIARLQACLEVEDLQNVTPQVANVYSLPDADETYDAAYMITVIGEIPQPERAMQEFHRVLKPSGLLAFSEFFPDPDYPSPLKIIQLAQSAGFRLRSTHGNWWSYSLVFEKP
jgi:ubiquinone/menaquinone biosynthesis C-methylase UbiE